MLKLNQAELASYHSRATSLANRARSALAKADKVVDKAVEAAVVGATAFALGVAEGKTGGIELFGVPGPLAAAVAAHGAGFLGVGGQLNEHLHAIGNGALAYYAGHIGRGVGVDWRAKGEGGGAALPVATSGHTMSDGELARMARGEV